MPEVVAACLWSVTPELLLALDERFGEPFDAYLCWSHPGHGAKRSCYANGTMTKRGPAQRRRFI